MCTKFLQNDIRPSVLTGMSDPFAKTFSPCRSEFSSHIIFSLLQHGKSRDAVDAAKCGAFGSTAQDTAEFTREVPLNKHRKGFLRRRISIASMLSWSKVNSLEAILIWHTL